MIVEVNGVHYKGWTEALVNLRLDTLSSAFHFRATAAEGKPLPFKGGADCTILVSGEKVLTGHIELVNVSGDSETHDIDIDGRDLTGDLADSKIGSLSDIRPPITLKNIIEKVIKHLGSDLAVIDNFNPPAFVKAEDLAAPEPGQDVWEFIQGLARKRQVLLTSDGDGNVIITQSSGAEVDAVIQNTIDDNDNSVIRYAFSNDLTGRFNKYLIGTQLNPSALIFAGSTTVQNIVDQRSETLDRLIRAGRQYVLIAEQSGSTPKERAEWEQNVRKARGRVYSCTVHGHRNQTGDLWKVNTLVRINDEHAGINSRMLVNSIQFSLGLDGGRETVLSFVEKNAYTLELEEPQAIDEVSTLF